MAIGYRIKTIQLESGERVPMLLSKETGLPLWDPTLFVLTELRATNLPANTLEQAARAVRVAHQVFRYLRVDLNERLSQGRLLTLGEIDALTKLVAFRQEELDMLLEDQAASEGVTSWVVSLEAMRARSAGNVPK